MKPIARLLLMLAVTVAPAAAQDRLSVGMRVRVALPQGEMIDGKIAGGDSTSLRVRVDGSGTKVIPRDHILLITTASRSGGDRAFLSGVVAGGISALTVGALTARCRTHDACRPNQSAMAGVGLFGVGMGALLGAGMHRVEWRAISASAPVKGNSFVLDGPEPCVARPALQVRGGLSTAGSRTGSAALSLLCHNNVTIGGEAGMLRDLTMPLSRTSELDQVDDYYYGYTSIEHSEKRRAAFVGVFGEWAIRGPMNPSILLSGGGYRRFDDITTTTYNYEYYNSGATLTAKQSISSFHTGMGAGVSFSIPMDPHVSFGFSGRTHFLLGDLGGTISTIEATIRVR